MRLLNIPLAKEALVATVALLIPTHGAIADESKYIQMSALEVSTPTSTPESIIHTQHASALATLAQITADVMPQIQEKAQYFYHQGIISQDPQEAQQLIRKALAMDPFNKAFKEALWDKQQAAITVDE